MHQSSVVTVHLGGSRLRRKSQLYAVLVIVYLRKNQVELCPVAVNVLSGLALDVLDKRKILVLNRVCIDFGRFNLN